MVCGSSLVHLPPKSQPTSATEGFSVPERSRQVWSLLRPQRSSPGNCNFETMTFCAKKARFQRLAKFKQRRFLLSRAVDFFMIEA
jgi:hypothetical protein